MISSLNHIPPAFVMFLGAVMLPFFPKKFRSIGFLLFPALTLLLIFFLEDGDFGNITFLKYELLLCSVDHLGRIFAAIFAFITFAGAIYAFHIKDTSEQVMALIYGGSAIGVTFSGDLLTLFFFCEVMAISSAYLVLSGEKHDSRKAGMRYLFVHLFGGSFLLAGILLHFLETGSLKIIGILDIHSTASWLILTGVSLNAAIPPLSAWLSDSYPKASITGAIFLSALTTKSAVYVLIRLFAGWDILIYAGVVMALYGVMYAVLANDIREILAYHIISQVGYMVVGVGIGTELALNGTTAHAFSHILYKALLFMGAGTLIYSTGSSKLTELGGLSSSLRTVLMLYMVGAFSISGFPLFNGFISKSMVVSAAGEVHLEAVVLLLHLASVGTLLSIGLKLPYFAWFSKGQGVCKRKPPINMLIGMGLLSAFCLIFGITPRFLYEYLPFNAVYDPFTVHHFIEITQLIIFTFIGFWLLRDKLKSGSTISLDTDWIYRRPKKYVMPIVIGSVNNFFIGAENLLLSLSKSIAVYSRNPGAWIRTVFLYKLKKHTILNFDPDEARVGVFYTISSILLFFIFFMFTWLITK